MKNSNIDLDDCFTLAVTHPALGASYTQHEPSFRESLSLELDE